MHLLTLIKCEVEPLNVTSGLGVVMGALISQRKAIKKLACRDANFRQSDARGQYVVCSSFGDNTSDRQDAFGKANTSDTSRPMHLCSS